MISCMGTGALLVGWTGSQLTEVLMATADTRQRIFDVEDCFALLESNLLRWKLVLRAADLDELLQNRAKNNHM